MQGKLPGFDNRIVTPGRFSVAKGGTKSKVLTFGLRPGGWGSLQGIESLKVIIPALPRRWWSSDYK